MALQKHENIVKFPRRHKFNARPVKDDNQHFASTLEHKYYKHLKFLQKTGHIVFFLRQVPFDLNLENTNVSKYIVDFQVFWRDGKVTFVDVKGRETDMFKMKKKMVEASYPVEVDVVKMGDF